MTHQKVGLQKEAKPARAAAAHARPPLTALAQPGTVTGALCACGGGCPRCSQPQLRVSRSGDALEQAAERRAHEAVRDPLQLADARRHARMHVGQASDPGGSSVGPPPPDDLQEEWRAHQAVDRLAASPRSVRDLVRRMEDAPARAGRVDAGIIAMLRPFTGPLPADLSLRTGPAVDRALAADHSRGLARGHEVWVGGPALVPTGGAFASIFVHEAAHVASGRSRFLPFPRFADDYELGGGWYEAERRRMADLEAAETGAGRQRTLERLSRMTSEEARRQAPGIAFRAQDRNDIELAVVAADRLLRAWLEGSDHPVSFTAGFGPDDAVDALLDRARRAFEGTHLQLAGKYLGTAMVQLVRAARAVVLRRRSPAADDPVLDFFFHAFLPLQRADEASVLERIQRLRQMLETQGQAIAEQGLRDRMDAFEAMAESVFSVERQAGPAIPDDLGTGGVPVLPASSPGGGRRAATPASQASGPPPPRPAASPEAPLSRAQESVVDSTHPALEGALVFHSINPQNTYALIRSPRYAIAGTLAGAQRLANEVFGRRSSVIVEDIHARDPQNSARRQVRYLALALSVRLNPPNVAPAEGDQIFGFQNLQMLLRPAARQYFFLTVVSGPWQFFEPTLLGYIQGIHASERGVQAPALSPDARREAIFSPIDALITNERIQRAADQLSYLGAEGFALVDTATKVRYLVTLLDAYTFEPHEHTVVEIFRSLTGPAELREVLSGLRRAGVLRKLYRDMETAFPSLLFAVGQAASSTPLSRARVQRLLSELAILRPFPGVEVRADGSLAFNTDLAAELREAVEGLLSTLRAAVTGIIDILSDPGAFLHGLYKLAYFAVMADLAARGNQQAAAYVARVMGALGRQLGIALNGLGILQENMPEGVEFVRDLQRSVEWRIVWEVASLFVGVGEAAALVRAMRGGRAAIAVPDLARIGRGARAVGAADEAATSARLAETAGDVGRGTRATEEAAGPAARRAGPDAEAGAAPRERTPSPAASHPVQPTAPSGELSIAGGRHRVGVRNGQISLCSGCGPLNDKLNHVLDIIPDQIWYRRYYAELRTDVRRLQRHFDEGVLTQQQFTEQTRQLATRLDRLVHASDPNLGHLLVLRVDELANIAPTMRTAARRGSDRLRTILDEFAATQRQGRTRARQSAGTEAPRDVEVPHVEHYPAPRGPATERGQWSGTPRNSEWTPANDEVWRLMGYRSIPYRNGYPDLSQFVFQYPNGRKAEVLVPREVFLSGGRRPHFDFADEAFARQMGWLTPAGTGDIERARRFRTIDHQPPLLWHHVEFDTLLQLVPEPIHRAAQHAGGISTAGAL